MYWTFGYNLQDSRTGHLKQGEEFINSYKKVQPNK